MRSLRNRTVTLLLLAFLLVGYAIGLAFASWQIIAVTSAFVIVAWLAWVSRRVHITASEVRRLGTRAAITSDQVELLKESDARVQESLDTVLQELRAGRVQANDHVVGAIGALRAELAEDDREFVRNVLQSIEGVRDEVRELQHAQLTASESLVEKFDASNTVVDRTKKQLNRAVRRQVEMYGMIEILESSLTARVDQFFDELRWELRTSRRDMSELTKHVEQFASARTDDGAHHTVSARAGFDLQKYLYYLSYHVPREIEAQNQLESTYRPEGLRPLLGGWALTPSGMLDIAQAISRDSPGVVVECGSGTSTMWIALALRASGGGHVYALEHDREFAQETRRQLSAQGLADYATVVDAPVIEQNGADGIVEWYDVSGLDDVKRIDVLVIDGPPQALGDLRKFAMQLLSDRFSDGTRVFADDVNRDAERTMVSEWMAAFPALRKRVSSTPVQSHLVWHTTERP